MTLSAKLIMYKLVVFSRFEEACHDSAEERGIRNMCDVLDRIELKGRQEGELEAKKKWLFLW